MHKYYKIFVKLLFGLLIFSICISLGLILFYSEVYEFVIIDKFRMKGRKRKRASKPNNMYNLQVHKFVKLYATENFTGPEANVKVPKGRSGHRIVCKDSALYAIGGYNPIFEDDEPSQNSLFCEVWRFDFITRTWKKLQFEKLPNELASSAVVLSGNLLFLHGGTGIPFGVQFNDNVFVCKLEDYNSKLIFKPLPIDKKVCPKGQYGQSTVIDGKYLYTVGGTDGFKYYMDVDRLNLETNIWERLFDQDEGTNCPTPRYRHEVVLYNNHLYVLGGGISNTAYILDKIDAFNLQTNKWVIMKTIGDESMAPNDLFPERRKCHGCVQDPYDKAIVFINGGYNEEKEFQDTWRLDLRTLKWKCMTSLNLPYGTYFHSASCTPDGRMIIFGGITNKHRSQHQRTADVFSTWIRVPKLADACWEALGFYVSNNVIQLPENLKSLELPSYYESRLKTSFSFLPTNQR